jgi:hypothetical protein
VNIKVNICFSLFLSAILDGLPHWSCLLCFASTATRSILFFGSLLALLSPERMSSKAKLVHVTSTDNDSFFAVMLLLSK